MKIIESLNSFKKKYSPIIYSLLKTAACEFKAGCLWTLDFVSEVLSKCFAWGVSYQSIFKILYLVVDKSPGSARRGSVPLTCFVRLLLRCCRLLFRYLHRNFKLFQCHSPRCPRYLGFNAAKSSISRTNSSFDRTSKYNEF